MAEHILVASHAWYADTIGGAFRLASELAEHLARHHRVSFVCCARCPDATESANETVRGVHVYRYFPDAKKNNGLLRLRSHIRQSERLIRRIDQEVSITRVSGHSPLQLLGATRALGLRIPKTYTVHSPFDDELSSNSIGGFSKKIASFVARKIDQSLVSRCQRIQTLSDYTLKTMISKHGSKARAKGVVAPGWVDTQVFGPADSRGECRRQLGAPWQADVPTFFTLRRLEQRMGLDTLVTASQTLAREGHQFRTLIGGGGALRESLQFQIDRTQLSDKVFLLGRLPEEQLPLAYAAADCFVLPSRALECFGLIVLEAFACNTPVIATNVAAIPELAKQQGDAWMVEPDNVSKLTDRMRSYLVGTLKPTENLPAIAQRYAKEQVLAAWEDILLDSRIPGTHDINRKG